MQSAEKPQAATVTEGVVSAKTNAKDAPSKTIKLTVAAIGFGGSAVIFVAMVLSHNLNMKVLVALFIGMCLSAWYAFATAVSIYSPSVTITTLSNKSTEAATAVQQVNGRVGTVNLTRSGHHRAPADANA